VWVYVSKYSAKFVVLINTTILARLLSKEDFGIAGYALLALSFIEFIEGLGIRQALIYYDENDERNNTGFWLGLVVGLTLLSIAIFLVAPLAGWFFKEPIAVPVTRAMAFSMPISSLALVHSALLEKRLAFKRQVWPELSNAIGKGLVSISMALLGFGAWSLIFGQLAGAGFNVIAFWIVIRWRPALQFERKYVRQLVSYGSQIIYNSALSTLLVNFDYLLVGRILGAAALGVYTLAFRIPELIIKQFSAVIGKVVFPVYATMRDDIEAMKRGFLLTMKYVNLVTVPMGLGLALVSRPAVLVIFGDKWVEGIPVMAAISIYSMLRAMVFNVGDLYKALGRPDYLVKIHIGQAILSLPALWWAATIPGTITAVAWMQVALIFSAGLIKLIIASRILNTPLSNILGALRPSLIAGGFMAVAVLGAMQFTIQTAPIIQLGVSILVGGVFYFSALWLLQRAVVIEVVDRVRIALSPK
jgi:PST family polysaccharide transporter